MAHESGGHLEHGQAANWENGRRKALFQFNEEYFLFLGWFVFGSAHFCRQFVVVLH